MPRVTQQPPRKDPPIKYKELMKSCKKCHTIEDAILEQLQRCGVALNAPSGHLRSALQSMWETCDPSLCELLAWQRIMQGFFGAINIYGNLERWMELRTIKTKRVYIPQDGTGNDDGYMPALVEIEQTKQQDLFGEDE